MYKTNTYYLYEILTDRLLDMVNSNNYDDATDYYCALKAKEIELKDDILCNDTFDTYDEWGRKVLVALCNDYETLARALTDEEMALDIIWQGAYKEVIDELYDDAEEERGLYI